MPNRLAAETSPYLRQHADNPVDWHPWGPEALELARSLDRPILLSVGYSACHWCHVMAHESFEDPATAAVMNEHFVNIKVDREERPDLDQIYQTAHAMLTERSGGWPLTMFLTPGQEPFFGGTYFPPTPRHGLPGFRELLPRVAAFYREQQAGIRDQNARLADALARTLPQAPDGVLPGAALLDQALADLGGLFDPIYGGLGRAPKFPHPAELAFLLRRAARGEADALSMAALTLERMAAGGVYDQLGGGFCRYSVDERWEIPHFEKMLYDNGPLLRLLADLALATGQESHARVARETAAWLMRDMQSPEGGYYATLDADSEHEEGKFYVWTPAQVQALLGPEEWALAAPHWGLDGRPNFEGHHWHLKIARPLEEVAREADIPLPAAQVFLTTARGKLLAARNQRVWPGLDQKVLASWNGLAIGGMARAGRLLGEASWVDSAARAAAFLRATLWRDGRLLACYKDGEARLNAYLDDHAFLLDGLLELLQARCEPATLAFAVDLAEALLARFEDQERGGFFFTSHDHETLIHRPKPGHDNATPSGNGVAALALQRLGHVLGEARYLAAAERALKLFARPMERHPSAFCSLLAALEEHLAPPRVVVLRGEADALKPWQAALAGKHLADTMVFSVSDPAGLPDTLARPLAGGPVNGWLCQGVSCLPGFVNLDEFLDVFNQGEIG